MLPSPSNMRATSTCMPTTSPMAWLVSTASLSRMAPPSGLPIPGTLAIWLELSTRTIMCAVITRVSMTRLGCMDFTSSPTTL
ncbi:hypothetical protein BDV38DRAFT_243523 [Aspergillus pseudotamarii]|uniref:Uncharacterized protein n=1 Tax=Aspergillus pseudotamarii TaxID=132259 RepID=A0A5N6SZ51_ASPPS|nr:uncharacterized protein BDV38DRAFT_243523 [Aspergillus pseudotamarii]KAE8139059.1 hypothetical protein BDV38DRAFT_243523 [Aspergillus pseudotamarii]